MTQTKKQDLAQWEQRQSQKRKAYFYKGNVTYGRDIAKPKDIITVSLLLVLNGIRSGKYRLLITRVRDTFACYLEGLKDPNIDTQAKAVLKANYQKAKKSLPWFSLAIFEGSRSADNVTAINGVILDFDEIRDAELFKNGVRDNIHDAYLVFTSPSGRGVKVLFLFTEPMLVTDENRAQVTEAYKYVYNHLLGKVENCLGVKGDHNTNDISRVCYVSYDPMPFKRNAYVDVKEILAERKPSAPELRIMNYELKDGSNPALHPSFGASPRTPLGKENSMDPRLRKDDDFVKAREVVSKLAQIQFEYRDFIKVGLALAAAFGDRGKSIWMLLKDNPNYKDTLGTMNTHWRSFASVKNITLATLFYVGEKYGILSN